MTFGEIAHELEIASTDLRPLAFALELYRMQLSDETSRLDHLCAHIGLSRKESDRVVRDHEHRCRLFADARTLFVAMIEKEDSIRAALGTSCQCQAMP